jgi:hypothetical protein
VIISVAVVGLIVVAVGGIFLLKAFRPVAADDVFALHVLTGVPASNLTDGLFSAYLSRSRRYRTAWSVAGWGSGLVLAAALTTDRVGIGTGSHQPFYADVLLMGFGGYLLGAVVSELHHLRRPRAGSRTASLTPRRLTSYAARGQQIFLRSIVGVATAVLVVGLVLDRTAHKPVWDDLGDGTRFLVPSPTPNSYAVPLIATFVVIVAVWLIVEATERAVVRRPRPAMPDDLALGDDAIRVTSVEVLTVGGSGLLALLTSYEAGIVNHGVHGGFGLVFSALVGIVGFLLAIGLAFRTRRLAWPRRQIEKDGVRA